MKDYLQRIHEASFRILAKTGIRFMHSEILEILRRNGIQVSGEIAYFTEEQIWKWIGKAPSHFGVYARNDAHDMVIGGETTEFAMAYGAPFILDMEGVKRDALFEDFGNFLKLVQQCEYFKVNGGLLVQPSDFDFEHMFPVLLYATAMYSDKCLMNGSRSHIEGKRVMDMLGILFGSKKELIDKPRIMTIINSLSPLQFDSHMLEMLLVCADYGQPVLITPAVMAGTTGPVTLAGTIALSNAETLAGIAVAQMIREGMPVVYGFMSSISDLRIGNIGRGSPEEAICASLGARLARMYGLPSRGGGTTTDSVCVSVQSGYESMMQMLVSCQERINLILHSAGFLGSDAAMSYDQFVIDLEIMGMIKRYMQWIEVNELTLALDVIHEVGPGGEFLTHDHTYDNYRNEQWIPELGLRGPVLDGMPYDKLWDNIVRKKENLLSGYRIPDLDPGIKTDLCTYLIDNGYDPERVEI